jgi:hypothetical protein
MLGWDRELLAYEEFVNMVPGAETAFDISDNWSSSEQFGLILELWWRGHVKYHPS